MVKRTFLLSTLSVLFSISLFLFIFSFLYSLPIDYDFGWHLRYGGEIVNKRHISLFDSFSYSFRGKPIGRGEWLPEAISYFLYSHWSFLGISLTVGIFISFAFFLLVKVWKLPKLFQFITSCWLVLSCFPIFKIGPRPQSFGWLFFSLVVILVFKYVESRNLIFLLPLPLIFLLWANFHPSYWLGLGVIAFFLFSETIRWVFKISKACFTGKRDILNRKKKTPFFLAIFFLLSFLCIFLKPASPAKGGWLFDLAKGTMLPLNLATKYSETADIRIKISEWLPPPFSNPSCGLLLLAVVVSAALFLYVPLNFENLRNFVLIIGFAYFSVLSRRNAPFFFIIVIPILAKLISSKAFKGEKLKRSEQTLTLFLILIMIAVSTFRINSSNKIIKRAEDDFGFYSQTAGQFPFKAVNYLKNNPLPGNMFNIYNWGGYLIWQLPECPVFIDGRMPATEIFSEYEKVISLNSGWEEILDRYKVSWMLINPSLFLEQTLTETGKWKRIYKDETAIILVRKEIAKK